jgi:hypothetical protein
VEIQPKQERRHNGLWVLASLVPFGLGTWAGFSYAGRKAGIRRWYVFAGIYLVLAVTGFALVGDAEEDSVRENIAATLLVVPWIVGIGHSLVARPAYLERVRSGEPDRIEAARERIERRDEARRLAERDPRLARELGVGRPDRDPQAAGGLVDMNSAPVAVIARLPGVDDGLAAEIVRLRQELDGFKSIEELGMTLDLSADLVEDLREWAVFLPR